MIQTHVFQQKFSQDQESFYRNAMRLWTEQAERAAREKASRTPDKRNMIELSPSIRSPKNLEVSWFDLSSIELGSQHNEIGSNSSPADHLAYQKEFLGAKATDSRTLK